MVVSAVPRACALGHSLDSRGFPWRGPAGGLQEGALARGRGRRGGRGAAHLPLKQLLPLRCSQCRVWTERMANDAPD